MRRIWSLTLSTLRPSFWIARAQVPGGRMMVMFQDDFGDLVEMKPGPYRPGFEEH